MINGYSAHADRVELASWIDRVRERSAALSNVWLVHGEPPAQDELATSLGAKGFTVGCPLPQERHDLLSSASRTGGPAPDRRLSTPERILYAAAARIVASGTANLSMQDVADAAGVSKGLIHYHFHDKETLLTRLIEWMTHESVDREAATLARSTPKTAVR